MFKLPANQPGRFDVKLPFKPRTMHPVYHHDENRLIILTHMDMDTVRHYAPAKCTETSLARRNLQVWVDTLGEALYNPVMWRYYPGKSKILSFQIRGMHRTRVLKALDFNFAYIYLVLGSYRNLPVDVVKAMRGNTRNPTVSTYPKNCGGCEKTVYDYFKVDDLTRFYRCGNCGFEGSNQIFYPLPM